jgi:ACT domain-containing protein
VNRGFFFPEFLGSLFCWHVQTQWLVYRTVSILFKYSAETVSIIQIKQNIPVKNCTIAFIEITIKTREIQK